MTGAYSIEGGDVDAERLGRQAAVMATSTAEFLAGAGLAAGARCLDVGCGQGQVAIAMATVAGSGQVTGTDIDDAALGGARAAAISAGTSVDFLHRDAADPVADGVYDLAFARLVLSHLADPVAAIRAMRTAVRPGGTVAVEDLLTGTLRSEPPWPVLDRLQVIYAATVRHYGGDPTIGPRLPALLAAGGIEDISQRTVVNPMRSVHEKLFIAGLVRNMSAAIRNVGVTDEEIDVVIDGAERAARHPDTIFYQAEMFQVSGRRPRQSR